MEIRGPKPVEKAQVPWGRYSSVYISPTIASNVFSLETDLATGNMVLSQISMSVRAPLPAESKSVVWADKAPN